MFENRGTEEQPRYYLTASQLLGLWFFSLLFFCLWAVFGSQVAIPFFEAALTSNFLKGITLVLFGISVFFAFTFSVAYTRAVVGAIKKLFTFPAILMASVITTTFFSGLCCGLGLVAITLIGNQQKDAAWKLGSSDENALELCQQVLPNAPFHPFGQVAIVDAGTGGLYDAHHTLSDEQKAGSYDDADTIVCVRRESRRVDQCEYIGVGDSLTINLNVHVLHVTAVDRQNLVILDSAEFIGSAPSRNSCPASVAEVADDAGAVDTERYGSEPSSEVTGWVARR